MSSLVNFKSPLLSAVVSMQNPPIDLITSRIFSHHLHPITSVCAPSGRFLILLTASPSLLKSKGYGLISKDLYFSSDVHIVIYINLKRKSLLIEFLFGCICFVLQSK